MTCKGKEQPTRRIYFVASRDEKNRQVCFMTTKETQ
jgi:hypothetical protein